MSTSEHDPTRLVLFGELRTAPGLSSELAQSPAACIAIGAADGKQLVSWCQAVSEPVVVDVAISLPDVMARLRGERDRNQEMTASIGELVGLSIDEVERALILQTLEHCRGNRTTAAAMLGISVRTMRNKLKVFLSHGSGPKAEPIQH